MFNTDEIIAASNAEMDRVLGKEEEFDRIIVVLSGPIRNGAQAIKFGEFGSYDAGAGWCNEMEFGRYGKFGGYPNGWQIRAIQEYRLNDDTGELYR